MKNKIKKLVIGVFAFAICFILSSTIACAGNLSLSAKRVSDQKAFIVTLKTDAGESYSGVKCDNLGAKVELVQQQGNIRIYRVTWVDSCECIGSMKVTAVGTNGTANLEKDIQVYRHDATDQELIDVYGDADRGDGITPGGPADPGDPSPDPDDPSDPGDPDTPGTPGSPGGGGGTATYGDPEQLATILNREGGIGEVVFDFLYLIAIILTFGCLCFLGINLMINRDRPEDRINTMVGFKYIAIGVLILWIVLLICDMVEGLMGDQEGEVEDFAAKAPIVQEWTNM